MWIMRVAQLMLGFQTNLYYLFMRFDCQKELVQKENI